MNERDLLHAIAARPRPAGSAALGDAREHCARQLRALGFEVTEHPFAFSGFPGRFATPVLGAVAASLVGYAGQHALLGSRFVPALVLVVGLIVLVASGMWLVARGVLAMPLLRERGVNLEAVRGSRPRVWLCAHLDSKSQPVPTLVRSAGILTEAAGVLLAFLLAILLALGGTVFPIYWVVAAVLTLVGAIPVVLSWVGERSPGAFDNASGVATVLAAAAQLKNTNVGVLLTDAEELGLAGARAWSLDNRGTIVLNCDGIDDHGGIAVMYSGRRPAALLEAIARASLEVGITHESMRMFPGVLTDTVAFAGAGCPSVTFSRGSIASLLRVHSRRDDLSRLRGTGVAEAGTLVAATAHQLIQGEAR